MSFRRRIAAGLTVLLCVGITTSAADARGGVTLRAAFDRAARAGAPTAIHLSLRIDPRYAPSPMTEIRLLYPARLGVTTSGLGIAECERPASDFVDVLISGGHGLAGCPRNAVIAHGDARAEIRFGTELVIPAVATLKVLTGPIRSGRLGLVAFVDAVHPFWGKLAYEGTVAPAAAPFGGALAIRIPPMPNDYEADVVLTEFDLAIGSDAIVYFRNETARTGAYRPGGMLLPARCPRERYPFRAGVTFADGTFAAANVTVGCPRARPIAR